MNCWYLYVGGFYTPAKFIAEAKEQGISRKVAANVAKQVRFGDLVTLLHWQDKMAHAFAEFKVTRITLDHNIGEEVSAELTAQGKAHFQSGGGSVVRACGSYNTVGSWVVDADIDEIMEIAEQAAQEQGVKLDVLIGGYLTRTFDPAQELIGLKFSRGLMYAPRTPGEGEETEPVNRMVGMSDYKSRRRKKRRDIQKPLA